MSAAVGYGIGRTRYRRVVAVAGVLAVGAGVVVAAGQASAAAGCRVAYTVNQWDTGFTANVGITNLGDPITGGWTLEWDYAGNQTVTQVWNARYAQSGKRVTLSNAEWNKDLPTNATANPGFNATYTGSNAAPTSFRLNGVTCDGSTGTPTASATTTPTAPPSTSRPPVTTAPTTRPPVTTVPTTVPPTTRPTTPPVPGNPRAFKGVANSACADLDRLKVSWWYNWYITPGGCTSGGEFVPMVSGKDKHGAGDIAWQRDQAINAGYKTILGFNEPNKADQSNMSVATAISLWPTLTANPSIRIGSPVVSTDGQAWFTDFMTQAAARNFRVDFIALHWYGWNAGSCDANAAQLESYIRWAESLPGNRPIWITELGCMHQSNPNMATVQSFYNAALNVFARHPRIERYAWYPWNPNNELVGSNGALTSLGTAVANAPATR